MHYSLKISASRELGNRVGLVPMRKVRTPNKHGACGDLYPTQGNLLIHG
jgi:hypothetical protein